MCDSFDLNLMTKNRNDLLMKSYLLQTNKKIKKTILNRYLILFSLLLFGNVSLLISQQLYANPTTSKAKITAKIVHQNQVTVRAVAQGKAKIESLVQGHNAFLGRLTLAAGQKVPLHQDKTEEYLYIIEGGGTITINNTSYQVQAGDSIYMPAKAKVSFVNGPKRLVAFQVFAGPESAQKYQKWPIVRQKK